MFRLLIVAGLLAGATFHAMASEQHTGVIEHATCNIQSKTTSIAGGLGGGVVGAGLGSMVGEALFGKQGRVLGGALGAAGGAAAGESIGSSTVYQCVVTVRFNGHLFTHSTLTTNRIINQGELATVVGSPNNYAVHVAR